VWCLGHGIFGVIRDIAGDKDRAPASMSLMLLLRGLMWRFSEAV